MSLVDLPPDPSGNPDVTGGGNAGIESALLCHVLRWKVSSCKQRFAEPNILIKVCCSAYLDLEIISNKRGVITSILGEKARPLIRKLIAADLVPADNSCSCSNDFKYLWRP